MAMVTQTPPSDRLQRQEVWLERLNALLDQIADWSARAGWRVHRHVEALREENLGEYEAPALRIDLPNQKELWVTPIAFHLIFDQGEGRVDLEVIPTLNRVKLLGVNGGWRIMTDSNVPIRVEWNSENFIQLIGDLAG